MTARCGGGTSSGRDEYGRFVYMAPAQIGALLNNIPTRWAVVFAGAIGSITYDLQTFCTTDPPADPGMTAEDWVALLNPFTLSDAVLARSRFRDWLGHYLWDTFCKCDNGTVPTPFTPPSAPADLPAVNDPGVGPTYPTDQACASGVHQFVQAASNTSVYFGPITPLPSGAATCMVDADFSALATTNGTLSATVRFGTVGYSGYPSAQFPSSQPTAYLDTTGVHNTGALAVPSGATAWWWAIGGSNITPTPITVDATASIYCGGAVPTPAPADPFTQLMLDQILQLVTLIQRQSVPFAYVFGAEHSGLSGSGHLDVQGLLGVKVQLDTWGGGVGTESADPDEWFNAGWITWGNADGSTKREWITHSPFVSLPAEAGQFTRVGYTLGSGVTATITELVREP